MHARTHARIVYTKLQSRDGLQLFALRTKRQTGFASVVFDTHRLAYRLRQFHSQASLWFQHYTHV